MAVPRERHIKLWTKEDKDADVEYFGKVKIGDGQSYASLRERLESAKVLDWLVDWPFEFWDVENNSRIRQEIEALNDILEEVHVIPVGHGNLAIAKRRRLEAETPSTGACGRVVFKTLPLPSDRQESGEGHDNVRAFRDMYASRVEGIPFDHFVPVLVELCKSIGDPWKDNEGSRASTLRSIPYVLATCREWRNMVFGRREYDELRLAESELARVTLPRDTTADEFVVSRFDCYVGKLSKSWELLEPMSQRLRTTPLAELSDLELEGPVAKLHQGWGVEATVPSGTDWKNMNAVWVTPSMHE